MDNTGRYACTICGGENADPARWFLVTENPLEDKLKILTWNGFVACAKGIHLACCPSHVQELVVHWMATGSVDHPFARIRLWEGASGEHSHSLPDTNEIPDTTGTRVVGELTVHRESLYRVLSENPESLRSILDTLGGALGPGAWDENRGPCEVQLDGPR